jgi:hypothetical protein
MGVTDDAGLGLRPVSQTVIIHKRLSPPTRAAIPFSKRQKQSSRDDWWQNLSNPERTMELPLFGHDLHNGKSAGTSDPSVIDEAKYCQRSFPIDRLHVMAMEEECHGNVSLTC